MRSPTLGEGGLSRRNSLPSRWQSPNTGEQEPSATLSRRNSGTISVESVSSVAPDTRHPSGSPATKRVSRPSLPSSPSTPKTVDVLVAEDNPISSKVIETILVRLGCRCVVVHNGEEVMRCTMGELVFDVIFVSSLTPPRGIKPDQSRSVGFDDAHFRRRKCSANDSFNQECQPNDANCRSDLLRAQQFQS